MEADTEFLLRAFLLSPALVSRVYCCCNGTRSVSWRSSSGQERLDPAVSRSSVLVDMQPDSDMHKDVEEEDDLGTGRRRGDTVPWPTFLLRIRSPVRSRRVGIGNLTDLPQPTITVTATRKDSMASY